MGLTVADINIPANAHGVVVDLTTKTGADINTVAVNLDGTSTFFNIFGKSAAGTWDQLSSSAQYAKGFPIAFSLSKASYPNYPILAVVPMLNSGPTNTGWWTAAADSAPTLGVFSGLRTMVGGVQKPDTSISINITMQGGGGIPD
jgi:hypothetical protein